MGDSHRLFDDDDSYFVGHLRQKIDSKNVRGRRVVVCAPFIFQFFNTFGLFAFFFFRSNRLLFVFFRVAFISSPRFIKRVFPYFLFEKRLRKVDLFFTFNVGCSSIYFDFSYAVL